MARQFVALTQDEIDDRIAESIRSREFELLGYDYEKSGHQSVVTEVDGRGVSWTTETEKYKGMSRDTFIKEAMNDGLTEQQMIDVFDCLRRDAAKIQLKAVEFETKRSEAHYTNSLEALPQGRRAAAFLRVKAKVGAQ